MKRIVKAFLHQMACPYALVIIAAFLTFTIVGLLGGTRHTASSFLTMNPFYPVQVGIGLAAGYLVGRYTEWSFAHWTWVGPAAFLLIAMLFAPIPVGLSRAGYLFGRSGLPRPGMIPLQLTLTMPFYLSAAYSLAAWKGQQYRNRPSALRSANVL